MEVHRQKGKGNTEERKHEAIQESARRHRTEAAQYGGWVRDKRDYEEEQEVQRQSGVVNLVYRLK
jgi:hypothetical protein